MSKLPELLNKFKESIKKKQEDRSTHTTVKKREKKKILWYPFFLLIFISTLLGGYIILTTIEKIKTKKEPRLITTLNVPRPQQTIQQTIQVTHNMSNLTKSESDRKIGLKDQPKSKTFKPKKTLGMEAQKFKKINMRKPQKETVKNFKREKKTPSVVSLTVASSPQEGQPILKDYELMKNLLISAEEEMKKGNYYEAASLYERYLKKRKDPEVFNNYGGVLFLLKDYKLAEKAFERAYSLKRDPNFKINLILTRIKLGKRDLACKEFKESHFPPDLNHYILELNRVCAETSP